MKPDIKKFQSAPGLIINYEKIEISHQNKKPIDEKIKDLALKQHETLINHANFENKKNGGKKTLKISETHQRNVYYESDRDIDISSDYRSSEDQEKRKKIWITKDSEEKIISSQIKKNDQLCSISETIHRGIRKPIKKLLLPNKQTNEGYLQINDDEESSPHLLKSNKNLTVHHSIADKIFNSDRYMKQFSTINNSKLQIQRCDESAEKQYEIEKILTTNTTDNMNRFKSTALTSISGSSYLK